MLVLLFQCGFGSCGGFSVTRLIQRILASLYLLHLASTVATTVKDDICCVLGGGQLLLLTQLLHHVFWPLDRVSCAELICHPVAAKRWAHRHREWWASAASLFEIFAVISYSHTCGYRQRDHPPFGGILSTPREGSEHNTDTAL